jgi:hypothetical protein
MVLVGCMAITSLWALEAEHGHGEAEGHGDHAGHADHGKKEVPSDSEEGLYAHNKK